MEMELAKCKIDIMSLNSQLLDAIQQKLNLSQQLEAWQVGQRSRLTFKWNPQLKSRICFLLLFFFLIKSVCSVKPSLGEISQKTVV